MEPGEHSQAYKPKGPTKSTSKLTNQHLSCSVTLEKREPCLGKTVFSGAATKKKRETKGATEQRRNPCHVQADLPNKPSITSSWLKQSAIFTSCPRLSRGFCLALEWENNIIPIRPRLLPSLKCKPLKQWVHITTILYRSGLSSSKLGPCHGFVEPRVVVAVIVVQIPWENRSKKPEEILQ